MLAQVQYSWSCHINIGSIGPFNVCCTVYYPKWSITNELRQWFKMVHFLFPNTCIGWVKAREVFWYDMICQHKSHEYSPLELKDSGLKLLV